MKIMLDECMTLRASRLIIEACQLHKPPIHAEFLEEHTWMEGSHGKGALDIDWAKRLAEEGGWSVITCDYQRPRGEKARLKGPPLHLILPAREITGFFLAGSMASRSGFDKFRCVISMLPEILHHLNAPATKPGSRFRIMQTSAGGYRMESWPLTSMLPEDRSVP